MSPELTPGQRRLIFLACIAALFTAAVEGTIVATAMPAIIADLGGFSLLAWVFASYMLTQAVTIPIYGRLADLYGRKRILFFGLTLFVIGSVLCGFAPTMLMLIIFRAVQGLGAGAIAPVTLTIVGDMYPGIARVRVQPVLASVYAGSSILGPVIGAFIVGQLSWPLIFWLNIPLALIAGLMIAVFLKETQRTVQHTLDASGALLLMASITLALTAMLQADKLGWAILAFFAMSALLFYVFLCVEKRSPEPLLPAVLWREPALYACNVGGFAVGAILMGITAFLPTYLQGVRGDTVFMSGVALSVMSFSWPVAATLSSRVLMRTTYRNIAITGGVLLLIGGGMMAGLIAAPEGVSASVLGGWWPAVAAGLTGAGLGTMNAAHHISMQEAAGTNRGIATAAQAFMRMLGGTFGTAVLGTVLNISLAVKLPNAHDPMQTVMDPAARAKLPAAEIHTLSLGVGESLSNVFWVALAVALIAAATAWLVPAVRPGKLRAEN